MIIVNVIKRDGRTELFDYVKLRMSINSARSAVECKDLFLVEDVLERVVWQSHDNIRTEELHDIVVKELIKYRYPDVATAYINYHDGKNG